jgi:hypothetical protein
MTNFFSLCNFVKFPICKAGDKLGAARLKNEQEPVFVALSALLIHKNGMLHSTNKIFFRLFFANLK